MKSIKACGLCLSVIVALSGCATAPTPQESDVQAEQAVLEASFSEAVQAMEQGDLAEARTRFEQLARDYPDKAGPMANLGIIAFQEGDTDTAKQWFESALAVNPEHVQALNHLGVIARKPGNLMKQSAITGLPWRRIRITHQQSLIWPSCLISIWVTLPMRSNSMSVINRLPENRTRDWKTGYLMRKTESDVEKLI